MRGCARLRPLVQAHQSAYYLKYFLTNQLTVLVIIFFPSYSKYIDYL